MFGLGVTSVRAAGWFETVAVCVCVAFRIAAHQRLSPRRGHFRYAQSGTGRSGARNSTFLRGFLLVSLAFCGAHGLFLGTILFLLGRNGAGGLAVVEWHSVGAGCLLVLVFPTLIFGLLAVAVTGAPTAEDFWAEDRRDEADRRRRNEEPWVDGR
ncbi:hypothetical protein NIIDNTM18_30470 [Mycolicibacterium litorale]|uniref:Transmembrane protein n=1 Tax=Mycolicibacterium litorale TaxID=758802 RepID=A0A6S6P5S5_9MYCO|nr:hypothetical protein NIIDNTM18_30470 [Mycolicibacterium litorale]